MSVKPTPGHGVRRPPSRASGPVTGVGLYRVLVLASRSVGLAESGELVAHLGRQLARAGVEPCVEF